MYWVLNASADKLLDSTTGLLEGPKSFVAYLIPLIQEDPLGVPLFFK